MQAVAFPKFFAKGLEKTTACYAVIMPRLRFLLKCHDFLHHQQILHLLQVHTRVQGLLRFHHLQYE